MGKLGCFLWEKEVTGSPTYIYIYIYRGPQFYLCRAALSLFVSVLYMCGQGPLAGLQQPGFITHLSRTQAKGVELFQKRMCLPYRDLTVLSLRYTPYRAIPFQGGQHSPTMVRYPFVTLSFTEAHLCDASFCNISRDNCARPQKSPKGSKSDPKPPPTHLNSPQKTPNS